MTLQEVTTTRQERQFDALPHRLHRSAPAYIGALDNEIDAVFDPQKNKLFAAGGAAKRWLLTNGQGEAVGRVAAFINPGTARLDPTLAVGGMGFFECIDDQAAANQLLDAACNWLKNKGMEAVDGPINFGDRDKFWGVLLEGFEHEPNYGMFWHPPYYQQLLENYGFQIYFKQYTSARLTHRDDLPLHPRFWKLHSEALAAGYRFTHANKANPEKLAQDFLHVYNLAWGKHAGVKEMTIEQARNLVGKVRFLYERWKYMRRPDKKMLGVIYGVVPEHQNKGLDMALIASTQDPVPAAGYLSTEMNWIGDFNPRMMVTIRAIGAKVIKTHATYRKLFIDRPFERYPIIR